MYSVYLLQANDEGDISAGDGRVVIYVMIVCNIMFFCRIARRNETFRIRRETVNLT